MVGAYTNLNIKPNSTVIDDGSKEQLTAYGYTRSYLKTFVFHLIAIICIGIPYVLIYWHDVFGIRWQYIQCPIDEAQVLVLEVSIFCVCICTVMFINVCHHKLINTFHQDIHGQTYISKVHQETVGDFYPDEYSLISSGDTNKEDDSETSRLFEEDSMPYSRFFIHQHVKYLWSKKYQQFQMLTGIEQGIQLCDFHQFEGLSGHAQEAKYENKNILLIRT